MTFWGPFNFPALMPRWCYLSDDPILLIFASSNRKSTRPFVLACTIRVARTGNSLPRMHHVRPWLIRPPVGTPAPFLCWEWLILSCSHIRAFVRHVPFAPQARLARILSALAVLWCDVTLLYGTLARYNLVFSLVAHSVHSE